MKKKMNRYDVAVWAFLGAVVLLLLAPVYFRVSGDLEVCRIYYPEMNRAACYFSSKTVRVPGGK